MGVWAVFVGEAAMRDALGKEVFRAAPGDVVQIAEDQGQRWLRRNRAEIFQTKKEADARRRLLFRGSDTPDLEINTEDDQDAESESD